MRSCACAARSTASGRRGSRLKGLKKIGNALVASASIIDFQNTRIDGVLMPTYQSGDLAILIPLTTAMGTMVRMVTRTRPGNG